MGNKSLELRNFRCEKGEKFGLFQVFDRTAHEVILGEDDSHLNFRVSLYIEQQTNDLTKKKLVISTVVVFNNWFGRFYFFPVQPFHHRIVPSMLKATIRQLEKK